MSRAVTTPARLGRTRVRPWWTRARCAATALALAALLGACGGGSGQSGSAFTFLSVDGFSLNGTAIVSSVPSSTSQTTTTAACVTLRNNLKNPTVTTPSTLDNVTVQSYTLTLAGGANGTFVFPTAVLVPAGTVTSGVVGSNTATFSVILVPAGAKGGPGTSATAELTFRGRDGRGQSVETEGAVTVVFTSGLDSDSSCGATATTTPPTTPTP